MSWFETPPFERGKTWTNQFPPTFDPTDQVGTTGFYTPATNLEGKIYWFPDTIYGTGVPVIVRCVRNNSGQQLAVQGVASPTGFAMQPGRLVVFDPYFPRQRVCQYAITPLIESYPVDELLPAAGVSPGDLFYIVISGPALVYTTGQVMNSSIMVGDWVAAITGSSTCSTSAATDGGGIAALTGITAATTTQTGLVALNARPLGRVINTPAAALTSATTVSSTALTASQTNTSLVVMVQGYNAW